MEGNGAVAYLDECSAEAVEADADLLNVGGEEGEAGEGGRADGKAFAGGGGGVAQRVESIGALAHAFAQTAHLGVAAGIVGNGAVGVGGEGDAESREHAYGGYAYAVEAHTHIGEVEARCKPRAEDNATHHGDDGDGGRYHAEAYARDDHSGGAGGAGFSRFLGGGVALRGIIFSGAAYDDAHEQTHHNRASDQGPIGDSEP